MTYDRWLVIISDIKHSVEVIDKNHCLSITNDISALRAYMDVAYNTRHDIRKTEHTYGLILKLLANLTSHQAEKYQAAHSNNNKLINDLKLLRQKIYHYGLECVIL